MEMGTKMDGRKCRECDKVGIIEKKASRITKDAFIVFSDPFPGLSVSKDKQNRRAQLDL